MSYYSSPYPLDTQVLKQKTFNMNLNQAAGTYTLATVSGGNINIQGIEFYNDVAATGLTNVSAATNDTTATTVLAAVALASLTGGKPLTSFTTTTILGNTKLLQYTITGTGTAGSIKASVRYYSTVAGADIS